MGRGKKGIHSSEFAILRNQIAQIFLLCNAPGGYSWLAVGAE